MLSALLWCTEPDEVLYCGVQRIMLSVLLWCAEPDGAERPVGGRNKSTATRDEGGREGDRENDR